MAFRTGIRTIEQTNPDVVELLPGVIPKAVTYIVSQLKNPINTGGMVTTKEDVIAALQKRRACSRIFQYWVLINAVND